MYSHVKAIEVSLWGRHVGTIVPKTATHYRFEYDEMFLRSVQSARCRPMYRLR